MQQIFVSVFFLHPSSLLTREDISLGGDWENTAPSTTQAPKTPYARPAWWNHPSETFPAETAWEATPVRPLVEQVPGKAGGEERHPRAQRCDHHRRPAQDHTFLSMEPPCTDFGHPSLRLQGMGSRGRLAGSPPSEQRWSRVGPCPRTLRTRDEGKTECR